MIFSRDIFHARGKLRSDARFDSFLGEIEAGFEVAEQVDQLGAHRFERMAEFSFLHRAGAGERAFRRRVEQVEQALRLRQRKLVVEKSALGEFAGPRGAGAEGEARLDDVFHDMRIAVARNFDRVLARVGMGRVPEREHHVVERFALMRERAVDGAARFSVHLGRDELVDDRAALRSAQTNDREGRDAGRRAEGDDGVGGHFFNVAMVQDCRILLM